MAAQASCVVVDYGCPDGTGDWVESVFPDVTVVRADNADGFNPSRARNLGVAAARTAAVCLIDADVMVAPQFVDTVTSALDSRRFYLAEPFAGDVSGTMICDRAAFEFAEGYDEACTGWGGEDFDLYERFEFHGLQRASFPASLLSALPHSDAERTHHHAERSKELSNSVNLLYSHIKLDLMRLSGARVPLDYRRRLHAEVDGACRRSIETGSSVRLELPVTDVDVNGCALTTTLACTIDMRTGHMATVAAAGDAAGA